MQGESSQFRHSWIRSALQTISGKTLRRLVIALCLPAEYDESYFEALEWLDVDRALAQVASSQENMEAVIFSVRSWQDRSEWAERAAAAVLSRLPVLQANKVPIIVRCHGVGQDGKWPMFPVE